ncbi:H-2 class II histocompatibility antigen, A-S alpha chain isoform X2 [Esox lucius]|uniref:H-2 class II histocompatibility antigen, A-S alpha chain isoform X2 n=1 Tax=Esox lucius TaxID=8010 RepID=UPI0014773B76|nr:H-2 class II histocompatibility antigen, A-S alpha chain isoform X2 [Esox lucius]
MCTVFVILHLGVISALVQAQHVFNVMIKRSKTEEFKMTACADGEEYLYVDLDNRKVVITAPEFGEEIECPICSLAAENGRIYTKELSNIFGLDTPEDKVPPDVMLYPKEEVKQGVNNSLVCFVNNFFPPPVQVKWTKNDVNITKEVKLSPYFFNTDITFYHFSTLTFDPEDGDLYTCTVEHPALDEPLTRKWVQPYVRLSVEKHPSDRHPTMLKCSAYKFYPRKIRVTWLRDGQEVPMSSTEELANGDWYYQIHSYLEFTPTPGEKISCMVEHPSLTEPMILHWANRNAGRNNTIRNQQASPVIPAKLLDLNAHICHNTHSKAQPARPLNLTMLHTSSNDLMQAIMLNSN